MTSFARSFLCMTRRLSTTSSPSAVVPRGRWPSSLPPNPPFLSPHPLSFPRTISNSMPRRHFKDDGKPKETVQVTFKTKGGDAKTVDAVVGDHILAVAHKNDIDLEGACEASLACSTCHVILPEETFNSLEEPSEEEEDMLDLAFGLTDTSRLGCQVYITKDMEGLEILLPEATRNFYVDGFKPKPH